MVDPHDLDARQITQDEVVLLDGDVLRRSSA
jgi:hypothetical protein